uniref:Uncharacterized protein LOC104228343 n=1 Tax=Nicotiana sylvestris TaxID=4096 RepID=A0A1U7WKK7_NICSY|nr:PREDICTED: uncharacterized protein LOC104228343 [Nicotiana sylvestris]
MEASGGDSGFNKMFDVFKLDRFDGSNFTHWKDKLLFFLTELGIAYLLSSDLTAMPEPTAEDSDEIKAARKKREDDEVDELLVLISRLKNFKVDVSKSLQVDAILAKLPAIWNDYRKKLLHSSENFNVDQLTKHIRIEEESRKRENKYTAETSSKKRINNVEQQQTSSLDIVAMISAFTNLNLSIITECNMAATMKFADWWYDSGATVHVCNDKSFFKHYKVATSDEKVLMGNHDTAKVFGKGTVELQFTSGKKLILINAYHVPDVRKNLISASLLVRKASKLL